MKAIFDIESWSDVMALFKPGPKSYLHLNFKNGECDVLVINASAMTSINVACECIDVPDLFKLMFTPPETPHDTHTVEFRIDYDHLKFDLVYIAENGDEIETHTMDIVN